MDWIGRINCAMNYIEENLAGEIDYRQAAKLACCSTYYFTRMFSYIAGVPLSEYVRHRRLTLAAFELISSDIKVLDLSLKYGYESSTAFSRAFQALHGLSPSLARKRRTFLKSYPRISFQLSIKGDVEMNYKIETRDGFTVAGIKNWVSSKDGENMKRIPELWNELSKEDFEKILSLNDCEPEGILGICTNPNNGGFDYYIAAATAKKVHGLPDELRIPACTWAIFESTGPMPDAIQNIWKRIFSEWFPTSGYERAGDTFPDIEVYFGGNTSDADYKCEVWIPVVKSV